MRIDFIRVAQVRGWLDGETLWGRQEVVGSHVNIDRGLRLASDFLCGEI